MDNNKTKALTAALKEILVGSQITDVLPGNAVERVCILQYRTPEGHDGSIQIGATDLGWWIENPEVGETQTRENLGLDKELEEWRAAGEPLYEGLGPEFSEPWYIYGVHVECDKKTGDFHYQRIVCTFELVTDTKWFADGALKASYDEKGRLVEVQISKPVPVTVWGQVTQDERELQFLRDNTILGLVLSGGVE